uniref:BTB domain-containing protein n=1 Tax=Panagrellus redivivus TaxID=6233 RepID=A0A7E4UT88_PANRE
MLKDSITLDTSTSALTETTTDWFVKSEEKTVGVDNGNLQWSFRVTGAGKGGFCNVFLRVGGSPVTAHGTVFIGPLKECSYPVETIAFKEPFETTVASIDPSRIGNAKGFIRFEINFEPVSTPKLPQISLEDIFSNLIQEEPDVFLSAGGKTVPLHRGIFSILSPSLKSLFSKASIVEITDFGYSTVKDTIDLCYGRAIGEKCVEDVIEMYKFSEKYVIGMANKKIEQFIEKDLLVSHFCSIAQNAWKFGEKSLQNKCAEYFRKNARNIIFLPEFVRFNADLKDKLICASANL